MIIDEIINNVIQNNAFYALVVVRLNAAIFLTSLFGIERELTGKVAGLRTHILVSAGACVFTLLSLYGFKMYVTAGVAGVNDPARIGAQIITGIGFIGAGTIMRNGSNILGITTAATLWMAAAIGMACGCGLFSIAFLATLMTLFVLILIRQFEKRFLSDYLKKYKNIKISIYCDAINHAKIDKIVEEHFSNITKIENRIDSDDKFVTKLTVTTRKNLLTIKEIFKQLPYIQKIDIQEIYE